MLSEPLHSSSITLLTVSSPKAGSAKQFSIIVEIAPFGPASLFLVCRRIVDQFEPVITGRKFGWPRLPSFSQPLALHILICSAEHVWQRARCSLFNIYACLHPLLRLCVLQYRHWRNLKCRPVFDADRDVCLFPQSLMTMIHGLRWAAPTWIAYVFSASTRGAQFGRSRLP